MEIRRSIQFVSSLVAFGLLVFENKSNNVRLTDKVTGRQMDNGQDDQKISIWLEH